MLIKKNALYVWLDYGDNDGDKQSKREKTVFAQQKLLV